MKVERTFCFVDLAGFSALTEAHGDNAAVDLLGRFTELLEQSLGSDDRLVKTIGDAALLTSRSPKNAVELVARLWDALAAEPDFPLVRVGIHHGPAVEKRGDVFGAAVNLAARVASQAAGGEVLATDSAAKAAEVLGVGVTSRGSARLRNIRVAVELYALDLNPRPTAELLDPVCRMRVEPQSAAGRLNFAGTTYWFCSLRCCELFARDPQSYGNE